jgi:hypothetical protein
MITEDSRRPYMTGIARLTPGRGRRGAPGPVPGKSVKSSADHPVAGLPVNNAVGDQQDG